MNIAYIRYNGHIQIGHHFQASGGFTDMRTNLFAALSQAGHKVTCHSKVQDESINFMRANKSIYKNIQFKMYDVCYPIPTKKTGYDFLIVENGASNTNFDFKHPELGKLPYIAWANKVINNFTGIVFYLQSDTDLPMMYYPEFLSMKFLNEHLHHGNFYSLYRDKLFVTLTAAKDLEAFKNMSRTYRYPVPDLVDRKIIRLDRWEMHHTVINKEYYKEYKTKLKPIPAVVYVGRQRSRMNKFKKYYGELADAGLPMNIYGRWDKGTQKKFPAIKWRGELGKGLVWQKYNKYAASIIIGNVDYENIGMVSARFFEVIQSKCIPIVDPDLLKTTVSDILSDDLLSLITLSGSHERDVKRVKRLIRLTGQDRADLIKELNKQLNAKDVYYGIKLLEQTWLKWLKFYKNKFNSARVLNRAEALFIELLEEREAANEFSKSYFNNFLLKYYKTNSATNDFQIWYNIQLQFDTQARCYLCGEPIKRDNVFASRIKCDKCQHDGFSLKRMERNLKQAIKTIEVKQ